MKGIIYSQKRYEDFEILSKEYNVENIYCKNIMELFNNISEDINFILLDNEINLSNIRIELLGDLLPSYCKIKITTIGAYNLNNSKVLKKEDYEEFLFSLNRDKLLRTRYKVRYLSNEIEKLLHKLNFFNKNMGFDLLRDAIIISIMDNTMELKKKIYVELNKRYDTTEEIIDRSISRSITTAYNASNSNELWSNELHNNIQYCPTTKEFIAMSKRLLANSMKEQSIY